MAKKSEYVKMMTPPFRVSFPNLAEPRPGPGGTGDSKFGIKMLFPKNATGKDAEMLSDIRKVCKEVAVKYWGEKLPVNLKKPFRDGDTESDYPEDAGFWIASARTTKKPGIVDQRLIEIKDKDEIESKIYGGCWARATIAIGATEAGGSKCVHFILQNLQKLKDDNSFGSRKAATEEFEAVEFSEAQNDFGDDDSVF